MFIINNKMLSFEEYLLSESIKPRITEYGTNYPNFDNKKINDNITFNTWFIHDKSLFWVIIDKNNSIAFMKSILKTDNPFLEYEYNNHEEYYMGDAKASYSGLYVFSKILFVLLEIANKYNIKTLEFNGFNNNLDKAYSTIMNNKIFLNYMKSVNWKYIGAIDNKHKFERI